MITFQQPRRQLHRLDPKIQARLDVLMEKCNDGQLSAREKKEFTALASEAHRLSIENARMLLVEPRRGKSGPPFDGETARSGRSVNGFSRDPRLRH